MLKHFIALATAVALAAGIGGCGFSWQPDEEEPKAPAEEGVTQINLDTFYVMKNKRYYPVVFSDATFSAAESEPGDGDTMWFNEADWATIPTLYEGDELVYASDAVLEDTFTIYRFGYYGWTFGLCGLQRTESGRYALDTTSDSRCINMNSSASKIAETLPETTCVIDKVGNEDLRSGNISPGNTITGLSRGSQYDVDVYEGTEMNRLTLTADVAALSYMEQYETHDYTYIKSKLVSINIPSYLPTGYYNVNGSGIFRYVKGKSYDENTDFNVPAILPEDPDADEAETDSDGSTFAKSTNKEITQKFRVSQSGSVNVVVTFDSSSSEETLPEPTAKVVGDNVVYTLGPGNRTNTLSTVVTLEEGEYKVVIGDLYNRSYKLTIAPYDPSAEDDSEEEIETVGTTDSETESGMEEEEMESESEEEQE